VLQTIPPDMTAVRARSLQSSAARRRAGWVALHGYCCYAGNAAAAPAAMVKETIRVYARLKPLGRRQQAGVGRQLGAGGGLVRRERGGQLRATEKN